MVRCGRRAGHDRHRRRDVATDTLGPLDGAIASVDLVRALLWVVAAIIIGAVVYLSALERQRDIAVLKAVGVSNRTLLASLAVQAVLVALVAVLVAIGLQAILAPAFPLRVRVPTRRSGSSRRWPWSWRSSRPSPACGAWCGPTRRSPSQGRGLTWDTSRSAISSSSSSTTGTRCDRSTSCRSRARPASSWSARPVGLRQDDAAVVPRWHPHAHVGHDPARRHRRHRAARTRARAVPAHAGRVRVPGVQPDPVALGSREHRDADDPHRSRPAAGVRSRRRAARRWSG
jgi:hypothetical protein